MCWFCYMCARAYSVCTCSGIIRGIKIIWLIILLKLKVNSKDIMLYIVQYKSNDVAMILLEDLRRSGELMKDFQEYYPTFYCSEDEFDDRRNLIAITVFPLYDLRRGKSIKEDLMYIAESILEERREMNQKISWIEDEMITRKWDLYQSDIGKFIEYISKYCENILPDNYDFEHLFQQSALK